MEQNLTLVEHLTELRKRIIVCLMTIFICGVFCFYYSDKILLVLSKQIGHLVFLKLTEAFFVRLKLAFYSAVFVSLPVIIYQIWKFVSPGFLKTERRYGYLIILSSYFLFVAGMFFAFYAVLPTGMKYLLSLGTENIQPMISVDSYLSFVTIFLLAFGVIFQLPLVILFLVKLGVITPKWLSKNRKYAIVLIFLVSGILTPGPDIFSQFMMAIPTLILYEISILLSKLVFNNSNFKKQQKEVVNE
ncbi:MAG: twin-arginine translocase subunit TatC [Elusimicrobia bacterium]|nr:twin-arginine translocase subunit TatC [Elusimicrobiota bacterium]